MENPFDYHENPAAYNLWQHTEWAMVCLSRSIGLRDYAETVLRNKALEHMQKALQASEQYRKESV